MKAHKEKAVTTSSADTTSSVPASTVVAVGIISLIISSLLRQWPNGVFAFMSLFLLVHAFTLFIRRRGFKNRQMLLREILGVAAFLIIVLGIKLTTVSEAPHYIQNDGYNATGGLLLGYLYGTKTDAKK